MSKAHFGRRLCVPVVAACIASAVGASLSPAAAVETPPAWTGAASAPDPSTGTVVLLAGDTWAWTGGEWRKQPPRGDIPSPRSGAAMAYDPETKTVVLFGGRSGSNILGDTHVWNGSNGSWVNVTPAAPAISPPARWYGTMAWDAVNKTVLLFGGSANTGNHAGQLNDTWAWNGTTKTWTNQNPAVSPPPRAYHTMAEHKATKTVVVFGGVAPLSILLGDTWTWHGLTKTWTDQTPEEISSTNSPPPRRFARMAYDAARSNAVLFGGDNVNSWLTDTWTWNGTSNKWKLRTPLATPEAPRSSPAMSYHAGTQKVVLFGGGSSPDTWTWNGTNWKKPLV